MKAAGGKDALEVACVDAAEKKLKNESRAGKPVCFGTIV